MLSEGDGKVFDMEFKNVTKFVWNWKIVYSVTWLLIISYCWQKNILNLSPNLSVRIDNLKSRQSMCATFGSSLNFPVELILNAVKDWDSIMPKCNWHDYEIPLKCK